LPHLQHNLIGHDACVKALCWCPWQSNVIISGGGTADKTIKSWDTITGKLLSSIDTKSQVSSIVCSIFSKEIISGHGYSSPNIYLWKYPTMQKIAKLKGHDDRILDVSVLPDNETIASVSEDETIRFWKVFDQPQYPSYKNNRKHINVDILSPSIR
jgi:WD40 repeat protein